MKDFILNAVRVTLSFPGKALLGLAQFVSPFKVKNEYIRDVYRRNINLFRLHLALAILVVLPFVSVVFAYTLTLAVLLATKDCVLELVDYLSHEWLAVYRPIARGFKEGLPRD